MRQIVKSTAYLMILKNLGRFCVNPEFSLYNKYITYTKKNFSLVVFFLFLAQAVSSLQVFPRVITPNGDGWNDKAVFQFDNPAILPSRGEIFDVSGAKVAEMVPGPTPDTSLVWDGTISGHVVAGGVYIYQIEVGQKIHTGAVVIAE